MVPVIDYQKILEKELFYLSCRQRILETTLKCTFDFKIPHLVLTCLQCITKAKIINRIPSTFINQFIF